LVRRFRILLSPAFLMAWKFRRCEAGAGYVTPGGRLVEMDGKSVQANARQMVEISVVRGRDIVLSALPLTGAAGQQLSLWLPLLEGVASVSMPAVTDAAALEEILRREEVTLVAATEEILRAMANASIASRAPDLRALVVFRQSRWIGELKEAGGRVLEGLAEDGMGAVIAASSLDPEITTATAEPQAGAREGSVGRLLPGIAGVSEADGTLSVYAPALGVSDWQELEMTGRFDDEGFLFVGEGGPEPGSQTADGI
jgi:acyl-CoA synthetase (AMP-forming)/AMP-acid ligase II